MISRTNDNFARLDPQMRRMAREAYRLFQQNPAHPGLRFKQVHSRRPIYSARVGSDYRAVGIKNSVPDGEDIIVWFWIGPHDDYEKLLKRL